MREEFSSRFILAGFDFRNIIMQNKAEHAIFALATSLLLFLLLLIVGHRIREGEDGKSQGGVFKKKKTIGHYRSEIDDKKEV